MRVFLIAALLVGCGAAKKLPPIVDHSPAADVVKEAVTTAAKESAREVKDEIRREQDRLRAEVRASVDQVVRSTKEAAAKVPKTVVREVVKNIASPVTVTGGLTAAERDEIYRKIEAQQELARRALDQAAAIRASLEESANRPPAESNSIANALMMLVVAVVSSGAGWLARALRKQKS